MPPAPHCGRFPVPGEAAIFGIAAVIAFALALLMHLFGWGSGKADVTTFELAGFLLLALHVVTGWTWRRGS